MFSFKHNTNNLPLLSSFPPCLPAIYLLFLSPSLHPSLSPYLLCISVPVFVYKCLSPCLCPVQSWSLFPDSTPPLLPPSEFLPHIQTRVCGLCSSLVQAKVCSRFCCPLSATCLPFIPVLRPIAIHRRILSLHLSI